MIAFLSSPGGQLALGVTLLLLVGVLMRGLVGSPARRHRWAEGVLISLPLCALLLVVPMNRAFVSPVEAPSVGQRDAAPSAVAAPGSTTKGATGETSSMPAPSTRPATTPVIGTVFTVGAAFSGLYLLAGAVFLVRLLRRGKPLAGTDVSRGARVIVATGASRPFCIGTRRRGLIVLPPSLAEPEHADVLEAVLAHERAHLDEGHGRTRLLAALLTPALFWNPLYWVLVTRMRADAELCADDTAARQLGKVRYVRALLALADSYPRRSQQALPILGALAPARPFLKRMETLMHRSQPMDRTDSTTLRGAFAFVLIGAVALVNAACGTTERRSPSFPMERLLVPFQALDLEGTAMGEALKVDFETEAPFPPQVQALDGKPISIEGYIVPLEFEDDRVSAFMLLRDNLECCVGGAPEWGHWLYAAPGTTEPFPFSPMQRVLVDGDFQLVHPRQWESPGFEMGVYELHRWSVQPID